LPQAGQRRADEKHRGPEVDRDRPVEGGRVDLLGASFHVDLYEVQMVDGGEEGPQQEVINVEESKLEELQDLNGGYEPLETITLNGKTYVMCIYPYAT